jgi:NTE family protein
MPRRRAARKPPSSKLTASPEHHRTVFVFQGGGALGAYQAGVYEGFADAGIHPDWMAGVSIGAINSALIAGNTLEHRVQRLQDFWTRVSSGIPLTPPAFLDPWRLVLNRLSSTATATFGVPGFFYPRVPSPFLTGDGPPETMSIYDTAPLRDTLVELVDFDLLNTRAIRLSVGAVNIRTGNSVYFDSNDPEFVFGPEHIMASGALPPGLPAVRIHGEDYWDGGIVSNTPLWYVLDDDPHLNALIAQVDLFSARGELPQNIDEVLERQKDIQYSSKTRFNTNRVKELESLRDALARVLKKLPQRLQTDDDVERLASLARGRRLSIVHLINRRLEHSSQSKDYEFSRSTVDALWDAGREAVQQTLKNPDWRLACQAHRGMRAFDLSF